MIIRYTSTFKKHFKKLPIDIKKVAYKKIELFRENPKNPTLKTHALTDELKGYWAFWIRYHYRVMFIFEKDGSVTLIDVGTHGIYG